MTFTAGINVLREEKFSDDEIISNIRQLRPDLSEGIETLSKEGFSPAEIVANLSTLQLEPRKLNKKESIGAGALEGAGGPLFLAEKAGMSLAKPQPEQVVTQPDIEAATLSKPPEQRSFWDILTLSDDDMIPGPFFAPKESVQQQQDFQKVDAIGDILRSLPESEDEASRRLRTGTAGVVAGLPFGLAGVVGGLIGSQAGQTVREIFGEDGKFDEFGWGEGTAILMDLLFGGSGAVGADVARNAYRGGQVISQVPSLFERGEDLLTRASQKSIIQGERSALENTINNFGREQIGNFARETEAIAPTRFSDTPQSAINALQETADTAYRNSQLSRISPLAVTTEEAGRNIQQEANQIFRTNVIEGERAAYNNVRQQARGTSGIATNTIRSLDNLEADLLRTGVTPEQQPLLNWIRATRNELQETLPPSNLLDSNGKPMTRATTRPMVRTGEELIELVQKGNAAVAYDSQFREQSHRLIPIINQLRRETREVLKSNKQAIALYDQANALHANNSRVWNTRYMRNVRFGENPESIIQRAKTPSNLRNFKEAITDPQIQSLIDRMVVEDITRSGNAASNTEALTRMGNTISPLARQVGNEIVNVKNPLTIPGGRAALRNSILQEVVQAVQSGSSPTRVLKIMETPKGLQAVRQALNGTPQGRELMKILERKFVEDFFENALDKNRMLDFKKAKQLLSNADLKQVIENIGGDRLVNRFNELARYADNLEKNLAKFAKSDQRGFIQKSMDTARNTGMVGFVLHALHVPWEVMGMLGIGFLGAKGVSAGSQAILRRIVQSPKAIAIIRELSIAKTAKDVSTQLLRLDAEIEKFNDDQK